MKKLSVSAISSNSEPVSMCVGAGGSAPFDPAAFLDFQQNLHGSP